MHTHRIGFILILMLWFAALGLVIAIPFLKSDNDIVVQPHVNINATPPPSLSKT